MRRTNSLRKLITTQLKSITTNVYYFEADTNALFPHIVFTLSSINTGDLHRSDYTLDVDIWDKSKKSYDIEELADRVEDLLKNNNLPQTDILPTFFTESRKTITDDDKAIKHILLSFTIQLYER